MLANLKIWCSKLQLLSGNHRLDLLTYLIHVSLVLRLPGDMHLCRSSSNALRLPTFLKLLENPYVFLMFGKVQNSLIFRAPATQNDASTCKSGANMSRFSHFHFEMCFAPQRRAPFQHLNFQMRFAPQRCVYFFDISTSKSDLSMVSFGHFDFQICFAPQRRALFRHVNVQKWTEPGVLCTFWLGNALRATVACTFPSFIWLDGSAPATLTRLLLDPLEPQTIGKIQHFAIFLSFHTPKSSCFWFFIFFIFPLFVGYFLLLHFYLSLWSEIWFLNSF